MAFESFVDLYMFMHKDQNQRASTLSLDDRKQLGAAARNLAYKLQINMILLCGTAKRRTYAHDLYYGIETLFVLFGKP